MKQVNSPRFATPRLPLGARDKSTMGVMATATTVAYPVEGSRAHWIVLEIILLLLTIYLYFNTLFTIVLYIVY